MKVLDKNRHQLFCIRVLFILMSGIVIGTILLIGVFKIPTDRIYRNVKDSAYIFDWEGTYPVIDGMSSKVLDNYTDALMLGEAVYNKEGATAVEKAMAVYHAEMNDFSPDRSLSIYMNNGVKNKETSYKRYWHGFLVILKPLLLCTNYLGIRGLNRVLQFAMTLLICICLYKKRIKRAIIPFLLSYLFLRPNVIGLSLQYSTVYYITTIAILIILLGRKKIEELNYYPIIFLVIGMSTSYFDFLTYPLVTLGVPLTLVILYQNKNSVIDAVKKIVGYSIIWGIGYIGMWSGKWLIGSMLLKENLFTDAIHSIKFRSASYIEEVDLTYFEIIKGNVRVGAEGILIPCGILAIILLTVVLYRNRKDLKRVFLESIPYIVIMLMPFCWYMIAANHSFIHSYFTYRELVIAVFAFWCMLFRLLLPD